MRLREAEVGQGRGYRAVPFIITSVVLCAALAFACWYVSKSQECAVTVVAWDREVALHTTASTVAEVLEEANIQLAEGDVCDKPLDTPVVEGLRVEVYRAEPRFVYYDGNVTTVFTTEKSVSAVLALANITPGPDDVVLPDVDALLSDGEPVRVVRVTYEDVWEDRVVAFKTETRPDDSIEAGLTRVYREGVTGIERVRYLVRYEDGKEVSRKEVAKGTVREPVSKIILTGTLTQMSRGGENIRFTRAIEVKATAYCPCVKCCGAYANGTTHIGLPAKQGVIAVDPRLIPLGTRVYVDGYGYAVAADTGGAIKGNRIDVCFDTHDEALRWGIKQVKVYVLE
ncbi:MAG TPA: DUF348 domain-containing protein [Firmicutes bacterium]|nr:DUF348 domain-containing protein [Candidatus Fermentithermobacillaceae bacterium]